MDGNRGELTVLVDGRVVAKKWLFLKAIDPKGPCGRGAGRARRSEPMSARRDGNVQSTINLHRRAGGLEDCATVSSRDLRLTGSPEVPRASFSASPSLAMSLWMSWCWPGLAWRSRPNAAASTPAWCF